MSEALNKKKYLCDQSKNGLYIVVIVLGVLALLLSLFYEVNASASGVMIFVGVFQMATKNKPILQFHEKYFEFKPALLASSKLIKYEEVKEVENTGKSIVLHAQGIKKPVRIYLSLFNKSERDEIAGLLEMLASQS